MILPWMFLFLFLLHSYYGNLERRKSAVTVEVMIYLFIFD